MVSTTGLSSSVSSVPVSTHSLPVVVPVTVDHAGPVFVPRTAVGVHPPTSASPTSP